MARPSSVDAHAKKDEIVVALAQGATLSDLAQKYGLSVQSLSRYRISKSPVMVDNDQPELHDVLGRAVELADDARRLRGMAAYASPGIRAKLIETETRVLGQLLDRLGVTDTSVAETVANATAVLTEVARWVRDEPEQARPFVDRLRHHDDADLRELGQLLAAQM